LIGDEDNRSQITARYNGEEGRLKSVYEEVNGLLSEWLYDLSLF